MRPATVDTPKWLLPVAGRPFAEWQLRWLAGQGVISVVAAIGHLGDQIRVAVGDGRRFGVRVDYSPDGSELVGTGGAVRLAVDRGLLDDRFLVLYGDSYLSVDVAAVWAAFDRADRPALMTVYENAGRFDTSNVAFDDGVVVRYTKHPSAGGEPAVPLRHIDYGLSVLDRSVADLVPAGAVVDLADVFEALAASGRLAGFEAHDRFYEIGSPDGLRDLERHLSAASPGGS
jgi:NDP-sugar pyrophosphorylase family protein